MKDCNKQFFLPKMIKSTYQNSNYFNHLKISNRYFVTYFQSNESIPCPPVHNRIDIYLSCYFTRPCKGQEQSVSLFPPHSADILHDNHFYHEFDFHI